MILNPIVMSSIDVVMNVIERELKYNCEELYHNMYVLG